MFMTLLGLTHAALLEGSRASDTGPSLCGLCFLALLSPLILMDSADGKDADAITPGPSLTDRGLPCSAQSEWGCQHHA